MDTEIIFKIGDSYKIHYVWRLPNDDYIRALFKVTVVEVDLFEERYLARIDALEGAVQEAPDGSRRPAEEMDKVLWRNVLSFVGNLIRVPYESADGRPLHIKYPTLTGEHDYFTKHNRPKEQDTH